MGQHRDRQTNIGCPQIVGPRTGLRIRGNAAHRRGCADRLWSMASLRASRADRGWRAHHRGRDPATARKRRGSALMGFAQQIARGMGMTRSPETSTADTDFRDWGSLYAPTAAGVVVNQASSMHVSAVYACVTIL